MIFFCRPYLHASKKYIIFAPDLKGTIMEKSLLMCDSTEGNGKAEIILDYVMSYSLRHAESKYLETKPMLCRYCRYMLGVLLDISIDDKAQVKSVEVWKEWQYIDLCVEATIDDVKYVLLIENKYYTKLHDNQLKRYKEIFDAYYDKKGVNDKKRRYKLISCLGDDKKQVEEIYKEELKEVQGFQALAFYDLLPKKYWHEDSKVYEDTEGEIFNEFWLRHWI